ncbi:hypothetical protein [Actinomadura sp. KC345]|uniref:hypothetical protein n=1 Tax=Actinomadura sp. KC345 TaxID=2530371 RepID=UPI0014052FDB|nr:hypothetical protein [Actinomadura sp. KC345]
MSNLPTRPPAVPSRRPRPGVLAGQDGGEWSFPRDTAHRVAGGPVRLTPDQVARVTW